MRISDWSSDVCSSDLQFVGNGLSCQNCHLDAGRKPDSAPMWAAWVTYPLYRSKNKQINTMEARIKGRSEEHTYELQSLMRISYAVFCLKKKKTKSYSYLIF